MTIGSLTEDAFVETLKAHIRPSEPIESEELLFGREDQLTRIKQAFHSPGRQIFIWGDRGVGKTSLAHTAAFLHHPASSEPVFVACGKHTSFSSIMDAIVIALYERTHGSAEKRTSKTTVDAKFVKHEVSKETLAAVVPNVLDINTAIGALKMSLKGSNQRMVVVIDEFERLVDVEDQGMFGELIKQLADQKLALALIFCGIGKSLDDLMAAHGSSFRYVESIELPRLSFTARWEIVDGSAAALGVEINDDSRLRIAAISDGFPHFVHLVCEKLFWILFMEQEEVRIAAPHHYVEAVKQAVLAVEAELKSAYEKATFKYKDEYQEVLWALADHFELKRNTQAIYASYKRIMKDRKRSPIEIKQFSQRLNALKQERCGRILESTQRSWYEFRENMVRGYVRLRAEGQGIRLAVEHEHALDLVPVKLARVR